MPPPPLSISSKRIAEGLSAFGVTISNDQIAMIREYIQLLLKWNHSISLTTVVGVDEILSRHFGESMFAASFMPVENCRLADVGTGAGFPGLPLKIIFPKLDLFLIESNKKKCAFLSEVIRSLGLKGIEVIPERFEEMRPENLKFDWISSRALGEFRPLLRWSAQALSSAGKVMLWLGYDDATKVSSNTDWIWEPAARIPESQRRFILVGRPKVNLLIKP